MEPNVIDVQEFEGGLNRESAYPPDILQARLAPYAIGIGVYNPNQGLGNGAGWMMNGSVLQPGEIECVKNNLDEILNFVGNDPSTEIYVAGNSTIPQSEESYDEMLEQNNQFQIFEVREQVKRLVDNYFGFARKNCQWLDENCFSALYLDTNAGLFDLQVWDYSSLDDDGEPFNYNFTNREGF